MLVKHLKKNRALIEFAAYNVLDKALVFLIPFLVLTLFRAKAEYVQLEYILSTVNIYATFTDLGINGYLFFSYQQSNDKNISVERSRRSSELVFALLLMVCGILVFYRGYFFGIDLLLLYLITRILFNYITTFLVSLFRILDTPVYAIYVSLVVNMLSLLLISVFWLLNWPFGLWIIFLPQAVLVLLYTVLIVLRRKDAAISFRQTFTEIYRSLKFSWPSMMQVFLMAVMANYGKVNALDQLSNEDAVFLGYTLRFCMVIQLAHASLVGFYAKSILAGEDLLVISRRLILVYLSILVMSGVSVIAVMSFYHLYVMDGSAGDGRILLMLLLSGYTLLWCFYSYLEMYYARINKNEIKLILSVIILLIFFTVINICSLSLLEKIANAMFFSILGGLALNMLILRQLRFKVA